MTHATPVRYAPDVETVGEEEAKAISGLEKAVDQIQQTVEKDYGSRLRGAHAKGHGLLKARLTVLDTLPEALAQGLFAERGSYDAVMRFSTAPGDILDDSVSGPRGLALKILGVEGERLPDTLAADGQDFLMVNGPIFPNPTPPSFSPDLPAWQKQPTRCPV